MSNFIRYIFIWIFKNKKSQGRNCLVANFGKQSLFFTCLFSGDIWSLLYPRAVGTMTGMGGSAPPLPFFADQLHPNLCQKHLFLNQVTHNITKDCSLIYQISSWILQAQNMFCTQIVFCFCFDIQNNLCTQHVLSW